VTPSNSKLYLETKNDFEVQVENAKEKKKKSHKKKWEEFQSWLSN